MDDENEMYEAFDQANKFKLGVETGVKIISAIKANDLSEVKRLMSLSADEGGLILLRLTQQDEQGRSAQQLAEALNNKEILSFLKGED